MGFTYGSDEPRTSSGILRAGLVVQRLAKATKRHRSWVGVLPTSLQTWSETLARSQVRRQGKCTQCFRSVSRASPCQLPLCLHPVLVVTTDTVAVAHRGWCH